MKSHSIDRIELLEYGSFHKLPEGRQIEEDNESPTGYFLRSDDLQIIERTSKFIAEKGLAFGIKYNIKSSENDACVCFTCKIKHPQLTNPATKESFEETIETKYAYADASNFDFYEFEKEWEMKEGIWTFQIHEGENLLLSKDFEVTKKLAEPDGAGQ